MKIVFIQNFLGPHFGIMHIAALLKQHGHKVDVFVEGFHKNIIYEISQSKADIIGFTCITGEHQWAIKRARQIKHLLNIPVIVGGPHPTYYPEIIKSEGIDMVCRGEGEYVVLELLNKMGKRSDIKNILGLWEKENGHIWKNKLAPLVCDLDTLPFADREIYDKYDFFQKETELVISTSRGCYFNCAFCYNALKRELYGGQQIVRLRSPENILAEIKFLLKKYPRTKSVTFNDDNICLNVQWFNIFFSRYSQEIGLPFIASLRADFLTDAVVQKLKTANCYCVTIGLETGNEELRQIILKKRISNETYLKAAKSLKKYGIKIRTSNMFYLPNETIENAFETVELNKKMRVDFPWGYALQPYPGTEIYKYSVESGFLNKDFSFDDIDTLGILRGPLESALKDGNKIKVLQRFFYYSVAWPGFNFLLKILIYFPNNFIFDFFHRLSLLLMYTKFHRVNLIRAIFISLQAALIEKRNK